MAASSTPVMGTLAAPVNACFFGPNPKGLLNDLPPLVANGPAPVVAVNGVNANKLGIQGGASPKTHG